MSEPKKFMKITLADIIKILVMIGGGISVYVGIVISINNVEAQTTVNTRDIKEIKVNHKEDMTEIKTQIRSFRNEAKEDMKFIRNNMLRKR